MSHTTKPSQKSRLVSEQRWLHSLPLTTKVVLRHTILHEDVAGYVVGYPETGPGILLRRTDEYGNPMLLEAVELDDYDYDIKEINGRAV